MGLSLRNITHKISDVLGGVERQVDPFDNGASYSRPVAPPVTGQSSFIQRATHYGPSAFGQAAQHTLVQPINRGIVRIGASAIDPFLHTGNLPLENNFLERNLLGTNTIQTYQNEFKQNKAKRGVIPAAAIVGLSAGTDLTPLSPGKKKAAEEAARLVSKSSPALPKVSAKFPATPVAKPGQGVSPAKNGTVQLIKKGLSDKDQVILDEMRNIDKNTPTLKGQPNNQQQFMYNSNMTRGSNAVANNLLQSSPNLHAAIGGLSKKDYQAFSDYANARTELPGVIKGESDLAKSKATLNGLKKGSKEYFAELKNYSTAKQLSKSSIPRADLQATVEAGHPQFGTRFEALNAHYKDLATVAHNAGLIDRPTFDRYVKNNDYIRLQRDMGDLLPDAFGQGKSYSLGSTILSQKRKGSARGTLPAGETAANYTQQVFREAARNKTATHLMDNLSAHGLAERVANDTAHQNTVKLLRDGKAETYRVSPQIKEAVQNINPYHMNAVMQILSVPGRTLRAGVTGLNPVFIARNLIKDQAGSAINSEHLLATHNPKSFFSGLWNASKGTAVTNHDPIWQDFLKHYGDQTSYDLTRNVANTQHVVNTIRGGTKYRVGYGLKNPLRSLENVAQVTEKSTRFQNFRGAYKKAIADGLPPEQASERAAIQAWQNSVDFSRAGEWGRVINTVIPYWNPATQGVRQMGRTFAKHPIKSSFTGAAILGVPLAAATAWNLQNEDTKKIYDNISENEKDNNLVLIPPSTKQNQDGTYDVIKIPLPPGYKDVFMPIRRAMEAYKHDKPLQANQIAQDILQATSGPIATQTKSQVIGSVTPQAVKPFVQASLNRDLFTGKQTVPDYMQAATDAQGNPVPRPDMAFNNTSGTARIAAKKTNQSPIKVEKFVKDVGGTVGLNLLNATDRALAKHGVIPKDQIGGQSLSTGFKKSFASTQGVDNPNKSEGAKYYDRLKAAQKGLNGNELAAWNSLHPSKKNFLGQQLYENDSTYNPAARLDVYNRFPKVFEADKKLDAQNSTHNPLYQLESWQVKKVLEKDNLPPGSKDPELSNLYKQDWYQSYAAQKSAYFNDVAKSAAASGKPLGGSNNPYPTTPAGLQKTMDYYSSLPKGTGARSAWIKANPGAWNEMQNQFAKVDNWQNIARGKRGLDYTEGQAGKEAGYPTLSFDSGSSSKFGSYTKKPSNFNPNRATIKLSSGGRVSTPALSVPKAKAKVAKKAGTAKPKVALKKLRV